MGGSQEKLIQPPSPPKYTEAHFPDLFWIEEESKAAGGRYRIPARFVEWKNKDGERARVTILFSGGHNEDLSDASNTVGVLQHLLRVNFLLFDYYGYGLHCTNSHTANHDRGSGLQRSPTASEKERFSEAQFEEVLQIAWRWLTTTQRVPLANIILYVH
jgi:hypothetical protein